MDRQRGLHPGDEAGCGDLSPLQTLALYDGIKQGAFAKYYDKDLLGMYLVKKIFLQGLETPLTAIAQLCIEEAIGEKIAAERPGIVRIRNQAFLEHDRPGIRDSREKPSGTSEVRPSEGENQGDYPVERQIRQWMDLVCQAREAKDTMDLIRLIDRLYNTIVDPWFENTMGIWKKFCQ